MNDEPKDLESQQTLPPTSASEQTLPQAPAIGNPLGAGAATRMAPSPSAAIAPPVTPPPESTTGEFASLVGPSLRPGSLLASRYEILQMLGQGGMGAVYKARDRQVDRLVAIKIIRPEMAANPAILQRFIQELVLARQITHRNVIRIYDIGEAEGIKFITMEYVEGKDLRFIISERGKLPPEEAVSIVEQIAAGLAAAHTEGVVHRDLKPGNIMQDASGRIVVMDFGLARTLGGDGMTQTGMMIGTMEYMSPEQATAEELDARSDLYTLGLIFYELLSGKMPFRADSALASLVLRTQQRATPVATIDPSIPAALSNIVSRCLERVPDQRYRSTDELIEDLRAWRGGASARHIIVHPTFPEVTKTGVWKYISVAVVAIAILVGASVFVKMKFFPSASSVQDRAGHAPITVLVGDFTNHTGDPIFDGTLEPMFNVALEGASFVSAFNRGEARKIARQLPNSPQNLDEQVVRLIAVSQNIGAVVTGSLSRRGDGYKITVEALDGATGTTIASAEANAATKDDVLLTIPKLAAPIRKALGDTTPESVQLAAAQGSFVASSLEAVHQYGVAMEQQFAGKMEDALGSFTKATELDPNFGRAYSGMAVMSRNLGRSQNAEQYFKMAMEHVDRMTERERFRTRGAYYLTIGNLSKCVEEYSALVTAFPSDNIGHNNLALCYNRLRDMPRAVEQARRAVELNPKGAAQRMNLSLYSSYAGDFKTGEAEARKVLEINPSYEKGYLTLADAHIGQGQVQQATEAYQNLAKISRNGASAAALGLADIAIYEGRFGDAVRLLEKGAKDDLAANESERAADKFAALAFAQLSSGNNKQAIDSAHNALAKSKRVNIRFLSGRVLAQAGDAKKAREIANGLASEMLLEPQVYGKLIHGEMALQAKDLRQALGLFTDANRMLDTWVGHFDLGRAYLEAGLFTEANSEFDVCIKRKGEAVEMMDDGPTFGYFPAVHYFQGRVLEGLKSPGYAESYRTFLSIRGKSAEDPLVKDVQHRLSSS